MNKEVEEAKEILKDFLKYFEAEAISRQYSRNISITVGEDDVEAIETLLNYIQELEEQVEYDKTHIFTPQTINLNYIPKQKNTR